MRIIKKVRQFMAVIAGEMYNLETGTLTFVEGKNVGSGVGYPRYDGEGEVFVVRGRCGYIYLPCGVVVTKFCGLLAGMLNDRKYGGGYKDEATYVVRDVGSMTMLEKRVIGNGKRHFVDRMPLVGDDSAFVWVVCGIRELVEREEFMKGDEILARFVCGVVFDADDLLKFSHGSVVFDVVVSDFRAADLIVGEAGIVSGDRPMVVEMCRRRGLDFEVVLGVRRFLKTWEHLLRDCESGEVVGRSCGGCGQKMFGYNYVVKSEGVVFCPFCLVLFFGWDGGECGRIRFPEAGLDDVAECVGAERLLCGEALGGLTACVGNVAGVGKVEYWSAGIVVVVKKEIFLFTGAWRDELFRGKVVFVERTN